MGSNVKRIIILLIILMFVAVGGIVLYANIRSGDESAKTGEPEAESGTEEAGTLQIGDDTRAFLEDETFFEPDKQPYSSIEKMEGKNLSLLMTSVQ